MHSPLFPPHSICSEAFWRHIHRQFHSKMKTAKFSVEQIRRCYLNHHYGTATYAGSKSQSNSSQRSGAPTFWKTDTSTEDESAQDARVLPKTSPQQENHAPDSQSPSSKHGDGETSFRTGSTSSSPSTRATRSSKRRRASVFRDYQSISSPEALAALDAELESDSVVSEPRRSTRTTHARRIRMKYTRTSLATHSKASGVPTNATDQSTMSQKAVAPPKHSHSPYRRSIAANLPGMILKPRGKLSQSSQTTRTPNLVDQGSVVRRSVGRPRKTDQSHRIQNVFDQDKNVRRVVNNPQQTQQPPQAPNSPDRQKVAAPPKIHQTDREASSIKQNAVIQVVVEQQPQTVKSPQTSNAVDQDTMVETAVKKFKPIEQPIQASNESKIIPSITNQVEFITAVDNSLENQDNPHKKLFFLEEKMLKRLENLELYDSNCPTTLEKVFKLFQTKVQEQRTKIIQNKRKTINVTNAISLVDYQFEKVVFTMSLRFENLKIIYDEKVLPTSKFQLASRGSLCLSSNLKYIGSGKWESSVKW